MKFIRDLYHLFFYLGNANKKKVSLRDAKKDFDLHHEKYAKKPVEVASNEAKEFIKKVEEETSQSWRNLMSHMIWIGGGAQVLIAQILLSDKLQYLSSYWLFKLAFVCLSLSLVISLFSFIINIIGGEFTMSADRAGKQLMYEIEYAKKQGIGEITDSMETEHGNFLDHAKIGGRAIVMRNGILLLAAFSFFIGIFAFVVFAGINLENLHSGV